METAFYLLAGVQVLLGLYGLWQVFAWWRRVRQALQMPAGLYTPRVALVCPLKGLEPGLEANLQALATQDYPDYELVLVLASAHDPAYPVARQVAATSQRPVQIVLAGEPSGCSEKVNNLRAAVEQLGPDRSVLVFADSDGRPGRRWLAQMVAPLADPKVGATTTFRWLLPGSGFWSALGAAWNASILSLLGTPEQNFCWGGGTALRREVFERARVLEFWRGAASDDWALTRALRAARLPIVFLPQCLVPSAAQFTLPSLLEFTRRQVVLTRVYAPGLWFRALLLHGCYTATVLLGLWVLVARAVQGGTALHIALLVLLVLLLSALRGLVRLLAVAEALRSEQPQLLQQGWVWTFLAPVVPLLYTWNLLGAAASRRIRWRGYTYEIISPNQTRIVAR
ncbi:MAG: glycosyltransferase [Acidobacteriia bacterium]|jgi:cellulose synthase/poly-beta-1,6-N-acetylglucosamine synthase-like glycosyltransferase|nr:glycosyltransferase [Terriglobia bacterium]